MHNVIIIGGGLGGLFTGAFLAKNGRRVTILEKGHTIGGGLQTFRRNGLTYETGMHILGGFQPGGSLHRICKYLGILDRLDLVQMPSHCMTRVIGLQDHTDYCIPQGREAFTAYLIEQFPTEAEGIRRYVDAIYDIAQGVDLFNLRRPTDLGLSEAHSIPVGAFLEQFTHDPQLLGLLSFMSTQYGGQKDLTPAYIHALINVLYINGTFMLEHGSQQLVDLLVEIIEGAGGSVLNHCAVAHFEVADRQVKEVVSADGRVFRGEVYISSLHPTQTIQLCSPSSFPKAYASRLSSIPNSYSAFKVFYELKGDRFPALTSPVYLLDKPENLWRLQECDGQWPQGAALFMTSSQLNAAGNRMLMAVLPMTFDAVRQWEDSSTGHRPDSYQQWKDEQMAKVNALIERHYQGFSSAIVSSFASTPLTFRDWLGSPEGSMYGYCKDASNMILSHLPIHTKVSNLLLTGQNINLHGICGVPLTAIQTAEAVLGQNVILDQIQQTENIND